MKNIYGYDTFVNEAKAKKAEKEVKVEKEVKEDEKPKVKGDYKKYQKKMLSKYGIKSPFSIKDKAERKKFFADLKKGWTAGVGLTAYGQTVMGGKSEGIEYEEDVDFGVDFDEDLMEQEFDIFEEIESEDSDNLNESKLQDEYRKFFLHVLELYEVKSPSSIKDVSKKKEFFNNIQKGWVKGKGLSGHGDKLMDCECLDECE